ncbi:MAG: lysophospholipid acyltransferase family protein [Pseudomonadota bacterium]
MLKSDAAAHAASLAIGGYIRLVEATTRWRQIGRDDAAPLAAHEGGFILAFWHARLLMVPAIRRETDKRVHMLISNHRDGDVIARAVAGYDIDFIRGSAANARKTFKNKSGAPALMQMIAALEAGDVVGMTPDGPRGPARVAQPGAARLALATGAPIVPVAYATARGRALATWDRFWLPFPFSRGAFVAGAPIRPLPDFDNDPAGLTAALTDRLNAVTDAAENAVGRSPDAARIR